MAVGLSSLALLHAGSGYAPSADDGHYWGAGSAFVGGNLLLKISLHRCLASTHLIDYLAA